jgi:FkbM family methyltransferase
MAMISYAQNGEDVLLRRLFGVDRPGFYIDVGAAHPVYDSVTKYFSLHGWRGINIEPLAGMFALLCRDRPDDINLNVALSRAPGQLRFYEVPSCDGWSTLSAPLAEKLIASGREVTERTLAVRTLAEVCAEHVRREIDFLKIDVEEHEAEVIAGGDWRRWRPRVVLVEATAQNSPVPNHEAWEPLLLAADYHFATFDGLNRYYVRAEDRELLPRLAVPPNVFDDFVTVRHMERVQELEKQLRATQEHLAALEQAWNAARQQLTDCQANVEHWRAEAARQQGDLRASQAELSAVRSQLTRTEQTLESAWSCLPHRLVRKARGLFGRARAG